MRQSLKLKGILVWSNFALHKNSMRSGQNKLKSLYKMWKKHFLLYQQIPITATLMVRFRFMVFNATFNNINISIITWQSVLLVEETGVPGENHWPAESHWQTLSHNVVRSTHHLSGIRTHNVSPVLWNCIMYINSRVVYFFVWHTCIL